MRLVYAAPQDPAHPRVGAQTRSRARVVKGLGGPWQHKLGDWGVAGVVVRSGLELLLERKGPTQTKGLVWELPRSRH